MSLESTTKPGMIGTARDLHFENQKETTTKLRYFYRINNFFPMVTNNNNEGMGTKGENGGRKQNIKIRFFLQWQEKHPKEPELTRIIQNKAVISRYSFKANTQKKKKRIRIKNHEMRGLNMKTGNVAYSNASAIHLSTKRSNIAHNETE